MTVLIWPFFDVEVLSPSPPEHQKVHHNSASNDPRLLKFCVHLPYGITPGCFWIYCDRTSGCRPCLQKLIYDHNSATNDPRLLNFFFILILWYYSKIFWTCYNRASGCRPPFKNWSMITTRQLMIMGFRIFLCTFLMKLSRDILNSLQPRQQLPPLPPKMDLWS